MNDTWESPHIRPTFLKALEAYSRAYAPYSKFPVGAALKAANSEEIYFGCNVENASYGGTICAERSALVTAVSSSAQRSFDHLVLITATPNGDVPCGLCLQVLSEFCSGDLPIYVGNPQVLVRKVLFKELFPQPFDKKSLRY